MAKQYKTTRTFNASLDRVWDAWVNPEKFAKWFGPTGFKARVKEHSLKPGGALHSCLYNDLGVEMWAKFVYVEISPKTLLSWEHSFSDEEGNLTRHPMAPTWPLKMLTTIHFEDLGDKTNIVLTWDPIECNDIEITTFEAGFAGMDMGWAGTWAQLDAYLGQEDG